MREQDREWSSVSSKASALCLNRIHCWLTPSLLAVGILGLLAALVLQEVGQLGIAVFLLLLGLAWYLHRIRRQLVTLCEALRSDKESMELLCSTSAELSSSLELDEVLRRTLQRVSQAVGATRGSLLLLEPDATHLVLVGTFDNERAGVSQSGISRLEVGTGLAGWVARHQQAAVVPDVLGDPRWRWFEDAQVRDDVRSAACVPLMCEGGLLGVMTLTHPRVSYFSQAHLQLLCAVACHVAIAIKNAQLYEEASSEKEKADWERSRLNAAISHLPLGLAVVDRSFRLVVANPAVSSLLGLPTALDTGQVLSEAISPLLLARGADGDKLFGFFADCMHSMDAVVVSKLELQRPSRHLRLLASPVLDSRGMVIGRTVVFQDVTAESEIDRMKSEFVVNVSHELRTPLASIRAYCEALMENRDRDDPSLRRRFLGVIYQEAERLGALIEDVLDLSKLETGQAPVVVSQVDMGKLIREVMSVLSIQAESRGIRMETLIDPLARPIEANAHMMRALVKNLISNAVKYNRNGGRVWASLRSEGQALSLEVGDTGVGIPADALPRLFDKFYRVQPTAAGKPSGSGLGLALVQQILRMHDGRIEVKSEPGKGSVFHVTLPFQWQGGKAAIDDSLAS